ncbi:hypothetical protein FNV43_RR14761 [Rhamnella rubrinervis]|uniref:Uncharacterized protein n=1 Tax=Rhamnella rubrinervis TaxID=2594499 RepID=A0A8K0H3P6_9ROSA|nr:hypothetical protein FNV43_RR14761 [Rhamnella rubrinervis]
MMEIVTKNQKKRREKKEEEKMSATVMTTRTTKKKQRNSQFNEANDQPHNRDEEKDGEHAAHVHVHTHVAYSYAHGIGDGIVVHSVIIGISLGACKDKVKNVAGMIIFFSLTMPNGIAIGIEISKVYDDNSTTTLIVEGILNAASPRILIYMSPVDMLGGDHMSPKL